MKNHKTLAIALMLTACGDPIVEPPTEPAPIVAPEPTSPIHRLPNGERLHCESLPDLGDGPQPGEVSTITKKTLREVLEDLEVLQERRQVRLRKKRRPMKMDTIELLTGDWDPGAAPPEIASGRPGFVDHGTNLFTDPTEDPLSTFAADVDTGSYTVARGMLMAGKLPPAAAVRLEEWVNYFTYAYPKPADGDPFSISLEAAPSPFHTESSFRLLRVGIQGETIAPADRKPVHLTFLVDVSGSMNAPGKLELVQLALEHLVGSLSDADTVAIATYAGRTETLLRPTKASARNRILQAIAGLQSGGGTAMNDGLAAAYELAQKGFVDGHENRVIVLSDGDANVGGSSTEEMLSTISDGAKRGVTLSTIGFGMGDYKDSAMEQLADHGNGNYFYIDGIDEARRIFGDQVDGTLQTIARDVKIQVEFNPAAVKQYRLLGYENRAIADADFREDKVDAGEIGAGHTVTALYEVEMNDGFATTDVATVRVRHKEPRGSRSASETAVVLQRSEIATRMADASDDFRFAAAVAAFAELSRKSPYAGALNHDWVLEVARGAAGSFGDRASFIELVEADRRLR